MSAIDELDALMAEITGDDPVPPEEGSRSDSEDSISEEEQTQPKVQSRASEVDMKKLMVEIESESDSDEEGGVDINVNDLDDLIAEFESQDTRRRRPRTKDLKAVEPRKTTARKKVLTALDGNDLDRVLEEIQTVSKARAANDMDKLGWGVVSTERKFDLLAPKFVLVGSAVKATIIVTTPSGDRSRVDTKFMKISTEGVPIASDVSLEDNKDGQYFITFEVNTMGKLQLNIDIYEQRQFEWEIIVCGYPDAKQCSAEALDNYRVNEKCELIIVAKDVNGDPLRVGGAKFGLGFNGVGQLSDVGLLDKMNGTYAMSFIPSAPGEYAIFITLDGEDIRTCPVVFTVR